MAIVSLSRPEKLNAWVWGATNALCAIALTEPRGGSDAANLRLRDIARTARLKGFRPGKAPFEVVKR